MNRLSRYLWLLAGCLFFASCKETQKTGNIPTFDLQKEYPQRELAYQDVADVEYIPLETTDSSLIKTLAYKFVSDDKIIIFDPLNAGYMFFDHSGKYLGSFSRKGQSGTEYVNIWGQTVDFDLEEIYVYEQRHGLPGYIKVYTFDGEYKRRWTVPQEISIEIVNYNKDYLFVEDVRGVDWDDRDPSHDPYYLMSKKTGELQPLRLHVEDRFRNNLYYSKEISETFTSVTNICFPVWPITQCGEQLFVADFGLDTIYSLKDTHLVPIAAKENRTTSKGNKFMTEVCMMTDKYLLLHAVDKLISYTPKYYLYDRENDKIEQVILYDRDGVSALEVVSVRGVSPSCGGGVFPAHTVVFQYGASYLLEKLEKGELKGKLKEVAEKLDVEDNPVLVLVKFKE